MRTTMKTFFASVACAVTACLVVSCASMSDPSASPTYHGSVSRVKMYVSIGDVTADSDSIVVGVAADCRIDWRHGMPYTVTSFSVTDSSDPSLIGASISIRQIGSVDHLIEGVTKVLESGSEYLLILSAFRLDNGSPIEGQYVVTGEQGGWQITRAGAQPIFEGHPDVASSLSPEQVAAILQQG